MWSVLYNTFQALIILATFVHLYSFIQLLLKIHYINLIILEYHHLCQPYVIIHTHTLTFEVKELRVIKAVCIRYIKIYICQVWTVLKAGNQCCVLTLLLHLSMITQTDETWHYIWDCKMAFWLVTGGIMLAGHEISTCLLFMTSPEWKFKIKKCIFFTFTISEWPFRKYSCSS